MSDHQQENDYLLSSLIAMAESGASMGITLHINGTIITGNLISQKQYAEGVVNSLREPMENAFKMHSDSILDAFSRVGEMPNGRPSEEGGPIQFEFIHLSEAKLFAGTNLIPTDDGVLWRGKLTSVDGFSFGRLS